MIYVHLRFRVACALKSFLHLHLAAGSHKGRVLVHDWAESRAPKYKDDHGEQLGCVGNNNGYVGAPHFIKGVLKMTV